LRQYICAKVLTQVGTFIKGIGSRFHELLDEELNGKRLQDAATRLSELIVEADKLLKHTTARIVRYGSNAE
jgi:hypothetical protein